MRLCGAIDSGILPRDLRRPLAQQFRPAAAGCRSEPLDDVVAGLRQLLDTHAPTNERFHKQSRRRSGSGFPQSERVRVVRNDDRAGRGIVEESYQSGAEVVRRRSDLPLDRVRNSLIQPRRNGGRNPHHRRRVSESGSHPRFGRTHGPVCQFVRQQLRQGVVVQAAWVEIHDVTAQICSWIHPVATPHTTVDPVSIRLGRTTGVRSGVQVAQQDRQPTVAIHVGDRSGQVLHGVQYATFQNATDRRTEVHSIGGRDGRSRVDGNPAARRRQPGDYRLLSHESVLKPGDQKPTHRVRRFRDTSLPDSITGRLTALRNGHRFPAMRTVGGKPAGQHARRGGLRRLRIVRDRCAGDAGQRRRTAARAGRCPAPTGCLTRSLIQRRATRRPLAPPTLSAKRCQLDDVPSAQEIRAGDHEPLRGRLQGHRDDVGAVIGGGRRGSLAMVGLQFRSCGCRSRVSAFRRICQPRCRSIPECHRDDSGRPCGKEQRDGKDPARHGGRFRSPDSPVVAHDRSSARRIDHDPLESTVNRRISPRVRRRLPPVHRYRRQNRQS